MTSRRRASLSALVTGLAVAVSVPALTAPVTAAEPRTETDLGGFFAEAEGAPLRVLVDDPAVPIPRNPGSAIVEADLSYTLSTFNTGPTGRALASTLWPGNLLGTGLAQVAPGAPAYPIAATSSYPGGPFEANNSDAQAFTMTSQAQGLDVSARAATRGAPEASVALSLGSAESTSSVTTVKDPKSKDATKDVSVAKAVSKVTDVSILGMLTIESVVTSLEARSDAVGGTSSGGTTVTGLKFLDQALVLDDEGVKPTGQPPTPIPGLPAQATDLMAMLGITITPPTAVSSDSGVQGTRVAKGLTITVDTVLARSALSMFPQLNDALGSVFADVPDVPVPGLPQPRGLLFYTLSAQPKITYVIGDARVTSSASLPLSVDFPEFPTFPEVPFDPGTEGTPGTPGSPPLAGVVDPGVVPGVDVAVPPTVAGGSGELPTTLAAATELTDPFRGVGPLVVLAGLVLAGLGARGLLGVQAAALGGGVLGGPGCALGASEALPDLRAGSASPTLPEDPR